MKCRFIREFSMLWETDTVANEEGQQKIPLGYFTVAFSVENISPKFRTHTISHVFLKLQF